MKLGFRAPHGANAMLAVLLICAPAAADPLHKVDARSTYRHEGSGWVFPREVGNFHRIGAPYTLDGGSDVGAEYELELGGARSRVAVDVYSLGPTADGAAAIDTDTSLRDASAVMPGLTSQAPFEVRASNELQGVKFVYRFSGNHGGQVHIYAFHSAQWRVAIRTEVFSPEVASSVDNLVRALPWDTLGSDPGDLHAAVTH